MIKNILKAIVVFTVIFSIGIVVFSRQNNRMVITALTIGDPSFLLIDVDSGIGIDIHPPINGMRTATLSPDGSKALIYTSNSNLESQVLYVLDILENDILYSVDMQPTTDIFIPRAFSDFMPTWSPDSGKVAYRDPGGFGLKVIQLDNLITDQVYVDSTVSLAPSAWSADSQQIVFRTESDLLISDFETVSSLAYDEPDIQFWGWSPDKRWLIYTSEVNTYLVDQQTNERIMIDITQITNVAWSNQYVALQIIEGVHIVDLTTQQEIQFIGAARNPQWSSDILAYQMGASLYTISPGQRQQHISGHARQPYWLDDSLTYIRPNVGLFMVDPNKMQEQQIIPLTNLAEWQCLNSC